MLTGTTDFKDFKIIFTLYIKSNFFYKSFNPTIPTKFYPIFYLKSNLCNRFALKDITKIYKKRYLL